MSSRRSPGWSDDNSSRGLFLPYDTIPGHWLRVSAVDPSTTTRRVRGLTTPLATITSGPPDACASERPWASPFKVFPSPQSVPLSGPMPSCRCSFLPQRSEECYLVTQPASRPCSCDESVRSPEPRVVPAVDTFLGFYPPEHAPTRPDARFGRGASPLVLGRLDVKARPGLRVFWREWVGRSVSGPPTLLGFSTFRRSRRSVHRSSRRAYFFASRPIPPKWNRSVHASRSRRNNRSRACCPAPAPFGLRLVTSSVRQYLFIKEHAPKERCLADPPGAFHQDSRGIAISGPSVSTMCFFVLPPTYVPNLHERRPTSREHGFLSTM